MVSNRTRAFDDTRYRSIRLLGDGAMGQVWEVEHRSLGSRHAAKIIKAELAHDEQFVARMQSEAQALAKLSHPNLVQVTDMDRSSDARWFFVMALLRGHDLKVHLAHNGRLPLGETVELSCQALAGLAEAHRAGLVHRDIKPANLFCCEPEEHAGTLTIKVVDFGVAKHIQAAQAAYGPRTATGLVVGTPRYLAPEQANGGEVGPQTDIYSLALVIYRMLTGKGPFDHHKDFVAMLMAHLEELPRPPSEMRADLPAQLDEVLLRALAKDPAARFPSAAAFAEALRAIPLERSSTAPLPAETRQTAGVRGGIEAATRPIDEALLAEIVAAERRARMANQKKAEPRIDATQPDVASTSGRESAASAAWQGGPSTPQLGHGIDAATAPFPSVSTTAPQPAPIATSREAVEPPARKNAHTRAYRWIVLCALLAMVAIMVVLGAVRC